MLKKIESKVLFPTPQKYSLLTLPSKGEEREGAIKSKYILTYILSFRRCFLPKVPYE